MGFKDLTPDNWLQPDPASEIFARFEPTVGRMVQMTGQEWTEVILAVEVTPAAPDEVRDLFAVARGAMVYGAFFYPQYSLAAEQLWRVADAAALARYRQLGGPPRPDGRPVSFGRRVRWLAERGAVPGDRVGRWDGFRELRNAASHPEFQ
jgi:hypothetical protein